MCHPARTVLFLALAAAAAGCARPLPPPGGAQDTVPPGLLGTVPEALAIVPGFTGPVVFRFAERISERNFSAALVTVSPPDGAVRVRRTGSEIRVEIDGGWRPDRIYRVVVLPGIRDLFGNARQEPAELVFSTGPPVPATAVAGIVTDRLTLRPVPDAVVRAQRRADEAAYVAIADRQGFFALRHLPMGAYDVEAFADMNRNRRRDAAEPADTRTMSLGSSADTLTILFNLLPPDTTPPRVTRAEVIDSLHVRVLFDDYFDPDTPQAAATARIYALPDSSAYAAGTRIVPGSAWDRDRRAPLPRPAAGDTAAQPPPDTVARPQRPPASPAQPARPAPLLPARELVIELDSPLGPGSYVVVISGAVNIHGLAGGGSARVQVAQPQAR